MGGCTAWEELNGWATKNEGEVSREKKKYEIELKFEQFL